MDFGKILDAVLKHLRPTEREGLQNLISLTFVVLAFVYVTIFLGDLYIFLKEQMSRTFPEIQYFAFILKYGFVLLLPTLYARAFLFAQDTLAYGRNRYARFFQGSLPSRHLARGLNCSRAEANELWFRLFNTWAVPGHPRHRQWAATHRRTYSCRFIYYLQRWLGQAGILFSLTLLVDLAYRYVKGRPVALDDMFFLKLLVIALIFYGALHVALVNRVGELPSGCWAALLEIEEMHIAWLVEKIVRPAGGDLERARQIAGALAEG